MMQSIKDEKHLQDAPRELTEFPVNSFVLVEYPTTRMGRKPPTKLHTQLKGPYRVITSSPYTGEYTLMNLVNNREENSIHVSRLRRFDYDPLVTDPAKIALRDHNAFFVEKIISHRGDTKFRSKLSFQVKWTGYEDEDNTWLPYSELRNNALLHIYLRGKGLEALIPKAFRSIRTP